MAAHGSLHTLPNPLTPLAFLPPVFAKQYETSIYIVIATMSVCIYLCIITGLPLIVVLRLAGVHIGLANVAPGRDYDGP